ncbi:hypothetical protein Q1695_016100 [Nippostrongylus brasiliensis]|nr:hypothetical protein Q1695_016100 [Nippostrongylus brasiliensis]
MIEEQPHSFQVIKVMLVAMAIVFALLATVTRAVCLFYPFLIVVVFEFSKYLIIFFLIALKLISYKNYRSLIELKGFSRLRRLTRNTRYEDELYYVWCAFCVVYFLLVSLTLIRNIMDYEMKARIEHGRDHEYHPAMVHPLQRRRRLVPREPEVVGNENIDDPPPYSSTIRAGSTVETAKEETDPPRYSQIELPLDRTRR